MANTILIVEENEQNMKLLNDVFQSNGYDTIQCLDGQNILQLARDNKIDLVNLNIQLSEVPSLDIVKALKADIKLRGIPVVAVTAHAMEGDEDRFLESGCDGYIAKPFSISNFLKNIDEFLK